MIERCGSGQAGDRSCGRASRCMCAPRLLPVRPAGLSAAPVAISSAVPEPRQAFRANRASPNRASRHGPVIEHDRRARPGGDPYGRAAARRLKVQTRSRARRGPRMRHSGRLGGRGRAGRRRPGPEAVIPERARSGPAFKFRRISGCGAGPTGGGSSAMAGCRRAGRGGRGPTGKRPVRVDSEPRRAPHPRARCPAPTTAARQSPAPRRHHRARALAAPLSPLALVRVTLAAHWTGRAPLAGPR